MNEEKFFKINGYEDYLISKSGKIYSTLTESYLKYDNSTRYSKVRLMDRRLGKFINLLVHRLVAIQFIPNPRNLPEVNHKDGNRHNNSVYNLEWCTTEYNRRHAKENGLYKVEEDNPRAKLTKEQVINIYKEYDTNKNKSDIAGKYNVSDALIGEIVRGVRWSSTYKEYYGIESSYKKPKRKRINSEVLKSIVLLHKQGFNTVEIQEKTGVANSYIGKLLNEKSISDKMLKKIREIKKSLDNQQPSSTIFGEGSTTKEDPSNNR